MRAKRKKAASLVVAFVEILSHKVCRPLCSFLPADRTPAANQTAGTSSRDGTSNGSYPVFLSKCVSNLLGKAKIGDEECSCDGTVDGRSP